MRLTRCTALVSSALVFTFAGCTTNASDDGGTDVATDTTTDASTSGIETSHGGRSLGEWMKLYWTYTISGTGTGRDMDVVYFPIPNGMPVDGGNVSAGTADVTLSSTDSFALPMFVWVGETYLNHMPADDDPTMPPDSAFTATHVVVTLDGANIIDSTRDNMQQYFFAPQMFDATIPYPMTAMNNAVGAIWVKGIGFLHGPLSRGTHTLHLEEFNDAAMIGYSNTWNITVN